MMNNKLIRISALVASLVLASSAATLNNNEAVNKQTHTLEFSTVKVPTTDGQKRAIQASSYIKVNGNKTDISFNTIAKSGDRFGDDVFGLVYDVNGKPIQNKDGSLKISNSNDFSSLLPVGDKLFMVSQFETRPAAMYISELNQDKNTGKLTIKSTKNIDFSKFNGLWVPCAGSVTPWNSHLGSEEYEPNAAKIKSDGSINTYYNAMADYFGGDLKALNPYDYGWSPEIKVLNEKGDIEVNKHYSMGRFAHELAYVMPDEKTVYLSDDGTNVGLFMFVADKKRDLSSGTLYVAKWEQISSKNGGEANLSWVNLGHSSNNTIKKALDDKITFNDMFEKISPKEDGTCDTKGFKSINTTAGLECLKIKDGMDEIASRLETRRYAALKGATTEFRKMEGITFNPEHNLIYLAMSSIGKGMEDNKKKGKQNSKYDIGGNNDIKLPYNKCGTVYALNMTANSTAIDKDGNKIDSKFIANSMKGIVAGTPDDSISGNKCSVYSIANPDNLTYIPNTNTLIIGEDTGSGHQNDYIWSYNLNDKKLTRILTTPYGSETTSPYYYNNIGGYGYLMTVIQHPYGEADALNNEENMIKKARNSEDVKAYTGYIGPLPVISK